MASLLGAESEVVHGDGSDSATTAQPDIKAIESLVALAGRATGAAYVVLTIGDVDVRWLAPDSIPAQRSAADDTASFDLNGPSGERGTLMFGWTQTVGSGPNDRVAIGESIVEAIEERLDRAVESEVAAEVATRLFESEQRLAETLSRLEQSNLQLEQFAYVAAHELLHPLRAVTAFSDLLPDLLTSGDTEALSMSIGRIREGTQLMQRQLTALLDLAAVSTSSDNDALVDSAEAVQASVDALADQIDASGTNVTIGDLPLVRVEPVHLQLIFHNLISNALRYREPGRPLRVSVNALPDRTDTVIEVADNGIGIESDDLERVFGIFERAAADESGSGIGLALVDRIMANAGGSVTLTSQVGQGSRFKLRFPAVHGGDAIDS